MRVLVTGVAGFVGSHFAEYALTHGVEVIGALRPGTSADNVEHLLDRIHLVDCDLCDPAAARDLIETARADAVVHLAGQSSASMSWQAPAETFTVNVLAQLHLLEAIRVTGVAPRFLVVGSGEEYGWIAESELPIDETAPLRPTSPYAVSKVAQDLMGYQYFRSHGLPIVRTRPFNHEGPRHADTFATPAFARQIAESEAGRGPPVIEVGNLDAERDFPDVRDIVRGYWLLLARGEPGDVYNLCSGRSWRLAKILDFLLAEARVQPIEVRRDPARMRPSDVPVIRGDASKIRDAVGWEASTPLEDTLRSVLDYWRGLVGAGR